VDEQPLWQHFTHDADIGIRGVGHTLSQAFEQAALALTAVITDLDKVTPQQSLTIELSGDDPEYLFLDWINEIIYLMATRKMLFCQFETTLEDNHLQATLWGEAIDVAKHQPAVEIKGATMTELKVSEDNGMWFAQTIVDV
jgi:SHS2 domain-containing protein